MKFFVAFFTLVAVAVAMPHNKPFANDAELQAIIDAINSPSTDPNTAILLQDMLDGILGIEKPVYEQIDASPVIIDGAPGPVVPGPIVPGPVAPGPVVPEPSAPASPALVEIIINVNGAGSAGSPVVVDHPVVVDRPIPEGTEAVVVDRPVPEVVEQEVIPDPVIVVEEAEVVEPVQVAPIVPPVVVMPDILN